MDNKLKVFILTEGGRKRGFGHAARCLSLYQAFEERGITPNFVVYGDKTVANILSSAKVKYLNWLENEKNVFDQAVQSDVVILDSYLAGFGIYEKLSADVSIPIYLDDYNRFVYPRGTVVNPCLNASNLGYQTQNEKVSYLLGPKYAMLRRAYWDVPNYEVRKERQHILVTLGGGNSNGIIARIVECLHRNFPDLELTVVLGEKPEDNSLFDKLDKRKLKLLYNLSDEEMKAQMFKADLAVSASGQTLNELARVGVPTVSIALSDDQLANAKGWNEIGFVSYCGWWEDTACYKNLYDKVCELGDSEIRKRQSNIGKIVVDGNGSRRIVELIFQKE